MLGLVEWSIRLVSLSVGFLCSMCGLDYCRVNLRADLPEKALTLSWACPSALSIFTKYIKLICNFLKKRCLFGFIYIDCLFMVFL